MSIKVAFLDDDALKNFMDELEWEYPKLYDLAEIDGLEVEINGLSCIEVDDVLVLVVKSEGEIVD